MRLARRQNAALAVKIHHVVNAQQGRGGFFDALYFRTERISAHWLNRFAEVIVCSTPPVENDWTLLEKQLGLVPREKPVIGYGIDLDQLSYSPSTSKQFEAVVLGRVHAHKGVFDLPEIWGVVRSRKPDARLLIVGEGPHREPLTKAFAAAGLKDAVIFTGGISDEEKNALLPQCKLGLSLSREEGWGLSITEYLAVGLPVVAMDLPIFHHVFPGVLDLTPMGNVERFADRILAWLNDSAATVAAGAQGRKFVARYDYREVARAELAVLLDGHRRHQARSAF